LHALTRLRGRHDARAQHWRGARVHHPPDPLIERGDSCAAVSAPAFPEGACALDGRFAERLRFDRRSHPSTRRKEEMPLFAVERDLSQVPPEHFRSNLPGLVTACARLQGLGKKVRYISSAVFPAEARGLCLFGAEQPQWIHEVNEAARLPYSRIFQVLDLTPTGVRRDLSRGRWPVRMDGAVGMAHKGANGGPPSVTAARVTDELARWSNEAHELMQVLGGWLEDAGRLQADVGALEAERITLAEEVRRLREENDGLRGERNELSEALQTLAGLATRAVDEVLHRIGGPR
jgi:hypothetical protein